MTTITATDFKKVRAGEYCAKLREGTYIYVTLTGPRSWTWFLGGHTKEGFVWETDNNGPFPSLKLAIADAIANYEDYEDSIS